MFFLFILLTITLKYSLQNSLRFLSEEIVEVRMGARSRKKVSVNFGFPEQKVNLKLSTSICGIWVADKTIFGHGYDPKKSETYEDLGIEGKVDFTRGIMIKERFSFGGFVSKEKIPILLVKKLTAHEDEFDYDGLIGFGFQCNSKSIGNINLNKIIAGNQPYFEDIITFRNDPPRLQFGAYMEGISPGNKEYREAPLDIYNINGHWEIKLFSIYSQQGKLFRASNKDTISIGIGGSVFSVKKDFFQYFIETIMKESLDKNECVLERDEVWEIFCDSDFNVRKIGYLGIIVGKWNFKLYPKSLFLDVKRNDKPSKWCSLVYYPEYDQYYFSQTLLRHGSAVVYDRENYKLGIYTPRSEFGDE